MAGAFHLSDQELQMAVDGELPSGRLGRVESHLASCWECRARKQELEAAIAEFIHFQRGVDMSIPSAEGPRALLKAQMKHLKLQKRSAPTGRLTFTACLLVVAATLTVRYSFVAGHTPQPLVVTVPNPSITPGATVLFSQPNVCRESSPSNKFVPAALKARVFAEYGIHSARSEAYEVDYLITPALGGADDIHNLWPESNNAALWNAHVKDALEKRLRDMVCDGQLDLQVAQHEIATNWIQAYKKYFHTDRPLTTAP